MSEGSGPRRPVAADEGPPAEGDTGKADTDKNLAIKEWWTRAHPSVPGAPYGRKKRKREEGDGGEEDGGSAGEGASNLWEQGAGGAEEALGVAYTWAEVRNSHRDRYSKVLEGIKKFASEATRMTPRCVELCVLVFNGSKLADLTTPKKGRKKEAGATRDFIDDDKVWCVCACLPKLATLIPKPLNINPA